MTPTPDLAKRVAGAVVERIATDRFCNSENIGDAVFRELAVVAAAKPAMVNSHEQTVVITYRDGTDRNAARQEVFNRLSDLSLPDGVKPSRR